MKKRRIINIIIQSVFLAIVVAFLTLLVLDSVFVDRATQLPHSSFKLTDWEWVHEDGTRESIKLPAILNVERGEKVTIETRTPFIIREGYWLMFYNSRDVKLYVGDELRYSFDNKDVMVTGGIVKGIWSFTKLEQSDYGKTIRIVRDSAESPNGNFKELYYGDGLGVCYEYVKSHAVFYFFSCLLVVMAMMLIIAGVIMRALSGHKVALVKLGIGMMCAALWLVFDSELFQLVFDNYYVDGIMAYMVVTIIPVPLLQYIDQMQKYRQTYVHKAMEFFSLTIAIVLAILHFAGISKYSESLYAIIGSYIIMTVGSLITIIYDLKKGNLNQYHIVAYGTLGFLLSALIELILMMTVDNREDGSILLVGFYFLLLGGLAQQVVETSEADRARRQAQEANRQKSNFLANMSHEIRTPINSIIGMNEMILRENKDPQIREYAMQVASSGRLLLGLINDVLDFSKIEAGKMEVIDTPFDTAVVINDIEVMMKERASSKKLKPVFEISDGIPSELLGDETHFKQILVNLISNAVKYTEAGSVTLSMDSSRAIAEDTVDLRVNVTDTGIGIRPENLDKLFDTFTRVDLKRNSSIEGTGLGLSIVKSLVEAMGGAITVDSTYGQGSTFTVTIPFKVIDSAPIGAIHDANEKMSEDECMYVEKFHAPRASILAVDDNLVNLRVVCELLKSTQISIDTASGGRECLEKCRDKHYNLILMDHRMPEPDGVETLHMLRDDIGGLNCDTPVIVLTANAFAGLKEKYVAEGFVDYISKPVDSKLLESKVMRYLPSELVVTDFENKTEEPEKKPEHTVKTGTLAERLRRVEGMDYDTTVATYGGSEEFMKTLLTTIVLEGHNKIARMKTTFANKDYKNYRVDAHAAKSDMATIGAKELSERAKAHEFAVRDGNYDFIVQDFNGFINEYQNMLDRIDEAL